MSDPIKEILSQLDTQMAQAVASGNAKGLGNYDKVMEH